MQFANIREQICAMVQTAVEANLVYLSAGNISLRIDDNVVAITPSGIKYTALQPDHIAIVDLDGNPIDAPYNPSSETPMHTHLLRKLPDVNAIFHTHSSYAITFAMLGKPIPVVNLELFVVGAPIPVAPWACPGTEAPGEAASNLFVAHPDLKVVLLRNHGLVAIGKTLEQAFDMAFDAEQGLKTYHQSLQIGQPMALSETQMDEIRAVYF